MNLAQFPKGYITATYLNSLEIVRAGVKTAVAPLCSLSNNSTVDGFGPSATSPIQKTCELPCNQNASKVATLYLQASPSGHEPLRALGIFRLRPLFTIEEYAVEVPVLRTLVCNSVHFTCGNNTVQPAIPSLVAVQFCDLDQCRRARFRAAPLLNLVTAPMKARPLPLVTLMYLT
ncbi:hypothetical protein BC830DRAFT_1224547 [Chytriomyces sp. MP71]|nr:hypothetical protein BC830DRAFT_1224547 [Chytriomyces sp. MP71]